MSLSKLKPAEGSVKSKSKRIGRGQGSGKGGTATRGHKGAKSRSGFKNINRKEYKPVNINTIQELVDAKKIKKGNLNLEVMIANNLVKKNDLVKVLGRGSINSPVKVEAHKFSKSAVEAIEKAGGETKVI